MIAAFYNKKENRRTLLEVQREFASGIGRIDGHTISGPAGTAAAVLNGPALSG